MSIILVLIAIVLYFAPWLHAAAKGHPNSTAILVLNLFLGWTLIGWVGALIWSVSRSSTKVVSGPG